MMRKIISIVLGIGVIIAGFFVAQVLAGTEKPQPPAPEEVLQTVFVEEARNSEISTEVTESGVLMAKNRIELFSEVQGLMESTGKEFKPGMRFDEGEILVKIRDNDYLANLQAQKSTLQNLITAMLPDMRIDYPDAYQKWDNYIRRFDVSKPVRALPKPSSEKERFFVTGRNIYSTYYNTKNMEITFEKYTLRAPFDGILTESLVTPGTLVRPGQKLGELIDPGVFELEIAVRKSIYPYLAAGQEVAVHEVDNASRTWDGKIVRINGRVNQETQTVQVFIEVQAEDLKEGMYLEALVQGKKENNAIEIDRNLLVNDEALYIVEEGKLKLIEVDPVFYNETTVVVKGVENGSLLVTRPVAGAFNGMRVNIFDR